MRTISSQDIAAVLRADFGDRCWVSARPTGRISVALGITRPDGSLVELFVEPRAERHLVTDLGETGRWLSPVTTFRNRTKADAVEVAATLGVSFVDGEFFCDEVATVDLAARLWALSLACARVAERSLARHDVAPLAPGPMVDDPGPTPDDSFEDVVVREIAGLTSVERNKTIAGASNHRWAFKIFVPATETVIAPVTTPRPQNLSLAYTMLSDVSAVNGFSGLALLDDRDTQWKAEDIGLMQQVSKVALWSAKARWLDRVAGRSTS